LVELINKAVAGYDSWRKKFPYKTKYTKYSRKLIESSEVITISGGEQGSV